MRLFTGLNTSEDRSGARDVAGESLWQFEMDHKLQLGRLCRYHRTREQRIIAVELIESLVDYASTQCLDLTQQDQGLRLGDRTSEPGKLENSLTSTRTDGEREHNYKSVSYGRCNSFKIRTMSSAYNRYPMAASGGLHCSLVTMARRYKLSSELSLFLECCNNDLHYCLGPKQ